MHVHSDSASRDPLAFFVRSYSYLYPPVREMQNGATSTHYYFLSYVIPVRLF